MIFMGQKQRKDSILKAVRLHNKVLLPDLASQLHVSVDTIRRDVKKLHQQGHLKKIHGGAVSVGFEPEHDGSNIYARDKKIAIADKAQRLIKDNSVILISGGTTNVELARILHPKLRATIFTPSLPVAIQLANHRKIEVIVVGGKLSHDAQVVTGARALELFREIRVDLCFLGTGFIDADKGLTTMDWEVVQLKKAMIKASKRVIALSISEKLNSSQRYRICDLSLIDTLITELDPLDERLDLYREKNINVL